MNFGDPLGLAADSLKILGSEKFKASLAELAQNDCNVRSDLNTLDKSSDTYVIAEAETRGSWTEGGESPTGLGSEQDLVDADARALGVEGNVKGIAFVGQNGANGTPQSWVAAHEATRLVGIALDGKRTPWESPRFDHERAKLQAAGIPLPYPYP